MSRKNQHVVPKNGRWAVRGAGSKKITRTFRTQSEAIRAAKKIARNQGSELLIHGQNGRIREKNTYGRDRHPPRG